MIIELEKKRTKGLDTLFAVHNNTQFWQDTLQGKKAARLDVIFPVGGGKRGGGFLPAAQSFLKVQGEDKQMLAVEFFQICVNSCCWQKWLEQGGEVFV